MTNNTCKAKVKCAFQCYDAHFCLCISVRDHIPNMAISDIAPPTCFPSYLYARDRIRKELA